MWSSEGKDYSLVIRITIGSEDQYQQLQHTTATYLPSGFPSPTHPSNPLLNPLSG